MPVAQPVISMVLPLRPFSSASSKLYVVILAVSAAEMYQTDLVITAKDGAYRLHMFYACTRMVVSNVGKEKVSAVQVN